MKVQAQLKALFAVVVSEARDNPRFADRLAKALGEATRQSVTCQKRSHRRAQSAFDPLAVYNDGEQVLRARLEELDIEQLKDMVAEYGMDPSKLVMKWRNPNRIVDHIVQTVGNRARKGDAFRV